MGEAKQYETPFANYPSRRDHDAAWEELARNIAATRDSAEKSSASSAPPLQQGELTILGSGIETVGFTSTDERLIASAEKVFYCVADPATAVWLKALRPDAYDLYVLYDETKVRYITYVQMTEAILYYVRQGKKVIAIYYGHPGIFVLSTHRALRIARREGHRATMRAGVSALDTLCADLGVDPSQPGMQTFEATDMLIRNRAPDTGLHVVLWQVGVIGELGYRRGGFLNSGLSVLIEYLQEHYGKDYLVTNYIGSRYPGIEPTIDVYRLSQLHDPELQSRVTGISTFYLAPKDVAHADLTMMRRLGLAGPGAVLKKQEVPLRVVDLYGEKELTALDQFRTFKVPRGYHWQEDTAAARFVLALRLDAELRDAYAKNPASAVSDACFRGLSDREKAMLGTRDAGAVQLAAKGMARAASTNSALVSEILCSKPMARSLHRVVTQVHRSALPDAFEKWAANHDHKADWSRMLEDLDAIGRARLFPWSGAYVSSDPAFMIFILGNKRNARHDRVFVNGRALRNLRFQRGRLHWSVGGGNSHNGYVHVDVSPGGARRLVGSIWPGGEEIPANHHLVAKEVDPGRFDLCQFVGDYAIESPKSQVRVTIGKHAERGPSVEILRDGLPVGKDVRIENAGLRIDDTLVPFRSLVKNGAASEPLRTEYKVRLVRGSGHRMGWFSLAGGVLRIDDQPVGQQTYAKGKLTWTGGPGDLASGELILLIDPITLLPMCYGKAGTGPGDDTRITGMKTATAEDKLRENAPAFGMPIWAWKHLIDIAHDASHRGGLFLWHAWERHALTHRILRNALSKRTFR